MPKRKNKKYILQKGGQPDFLKFKHIDLNNPIDHTVAPIIGATTLGEQVQRLQKPQETVKQISQKEFDKNASLADILSNPVTALKYKLHNQQIPSNFTKGDRNVYDNAVDAVNPMTYINAAKNTLNRVIHPVNTINQIVDNPQTALNIVGDAAITAPVVKYLGDAAKEIPFGKGIGSTIDNINYAINKPKTVDKIPSKWINRELGDPISQTGLFNQGVYNLKRFPDYLAKFEDPTNIAFRTGNSNYVKFNFVDAMKDLPQDLPIARVYNQVKVPGTHNRALIMNKLTGLNGDQLKPFHFDEMTPSSYEGFYNTLKTLKDNNLSFDFMGDNYMYNPDTKQFSLLDLAPAMPYDGGGPASQWNSQIFEGITPYNKSLRPETVRMAIADKLSRDYARSYYSNLSEYGYPKDHNMYKGTILNSTKHLTEFKNGGMKSKKIKKFQFAGSNPCGEGTQWDPNTMQCVPVPTDPNRQQPPAYQQETGTPDFNPIPITGSPDFHPLADGFTLDSDGVYRKKVITTDKNSLEYSDPFKFLNLWLDTTSAIAGKVNDANTLKQERYRLMKERYNKAQFNINENGINNVPVYFKNGGGLTPNKARQILHDGKVNGKKLTDKQRKFFGYMSQGNTMHYQIGGTPLTQDQLSQFSNFANSTDTNKINQTLDKYGLKGVSNLYEPIQLNAQLGNDIRSTRQDWIGSETMSALLNAKRLNIPPEAFLANKKVIFGSDGRYGDTVLNNQDFQRMYPNYLEVVNNIYRDRYNNFKPEQTQVAQNYATGGIHLNPKHKGLFTKEAKAAGMGVQEFAAHVLANKDKYSSDVVKRAVFAHNFAHQNGGYVNNTGYTPGTSTYDNPYNIIPSNNITMENTPFPIMAITDNGQTAMMHPGHKYNFKGAKYVKEIPLKQNGGTPEVEGQGPGEGPAELEEGEVYQTQQGPIQKIAEDAGTHEDGGVIRNDVSRVLEDTSDKRKDPASKLLRVTPNDAKELVGFKPKGTVTHSKLYEQAVNFYDKKLLSLENKISNNLDYIKQNGGQYAKNSLEQNLKLLQSLPTKAQIFDQIYNHQETVKAVHGINDMEKNKYGGLPKYAVGGPDEPVDPYKGGKTKKGKTTPTGKDNAFVFPGGLPAYQDAWANAGIDLSKYTKNSDAQAAIYDYLLQTNPDVIRNMWKTYGNTAAGIKAGLPSTFDDNYLSNIDNLKKLKSAYADNYFGVRTLVPQQQETTLPPIVINGKPNNNTGTDNTQYTKPEPVKPSTFNEPLHWYDVAGTLDNYLSSNERTPVTFEQLKRDPLRAHELNPLPTLLANQGDYNTALQQLPTNGVGFANAANLAANKYKVNNEVLGQYENINKGKADQIDNINNQAQFNLDLQNLNLRDRAQQQQLAAMEAQRQSKLKALDDLFTTIAENRKLNREGNLVLQTTPYFDQYGNFNGNQYVQHIDNQGNLNIIDKTTGKIVQTYTKDANGQLKGSKYTVISNSK